ncbi:MAG: MYG1 family protein [bacterium]|nr:MYG1 family protein [bacterium]
MKKTILTHDGKFHADDVFAVAAITLLHFDAEVVRSRDPKRITSADIVVDVGGIYDKDANRFDHHQIGGAGVRENTIPYAAFGLVWRNFAEKLCGDNAIAAQVEKVLVVPIDANDNGIDLSTPKHQDISPYEVPDAIRAFIPTWQEREDGLDAAFAEAVAFAKRVIEREIKRAEAVVAGQKKVEDVYATSSDNRLIVLDEDYSWKDTLARFPEPLYVVHPQSETWRLYCVRDNPHLFANRKDLPQEWAGLRDEELAKVTGVSDAIFCHRNRFMAVAKSEQGALELAKQALNS